MSHEPNPQHLHEGDTDTITKPALPHLVTIDELIRLHASGAPPLPSGIVRCAEITGPADMAKIAAYFGIPVKLEN